MKIDEKLLDVSEKSQRRIDRIGIVLGVSLLIACGFSYFVLDAFGQQDVTIECPKNAYHGLDNQGNKACRDIQTNQILEPESAIIANSDSEGTESNSGLITIPETGEIIFNGEQIPIFETIILVLIGIAGSVIGISVKKGKFKLFQRPGWSSIQRPGWSSIQRPGWSGTQKEQVRDRQYGKCNMCFTPPSQWKYDHIDGNKRNNELNNCQGLCPNCLAIKIERNSRSIYQELN